MTVYHCRLSRSNCPKVFHSPTSPLLFFIGFSVAGNSPLFPKVKRRHPEGLSAGRSSSDRGKKLLYGMPTAVRGKWRIFESIQIPFLFFMGSRIIILVLETAIRL